MRARERKDKSNKTICAQFLFAKLFVQIILHLFASILSERDIDKCAHSMEVVGGWVATIDGDRRHSF